MGRGPPIGRAPGAPVRVGCIGRRCPGTNGGREPGALEPPMPPDCGRGRWNMGCPRTGRPPLGRCPAEGAPACCVGAFGRTVGAGREGALYTGRGPVCGTMSRRAAGTIGLPGSMAGGAGASFSTAGGAATFATGSGAAGGSTIGASTFGAAGFSAAALRTASAEMATPPVGLAAATAGVSGAFGFSTAGATGAVGFAAAGFVAAGAGGAALAIAGVSAAPGFLMALSTSPGLDILEKSNFGLGASAAFDARDSSLEALAPGPKYLRMRSASSASTELECVFFSVTPTFSKTSRISLLFTSSSLARSLIRTFDILLLKPVTRSGSLFHA